VTQVPAVCAAVVAVTGEIPVILAKRFSVMGDCRPIAGPAVAAQLSAILTKVRPIGAPVVAVLPKLTAILAAVDAVLVQAAKIALCFGVPSRLCDGRYRLIRVRRGGCGLSGGGDAGEEAPDADGECVLDEFHTT
jgi:hypothetical protein